MNYKNKKKNHDYWLSRLKEKNSNEVCTNDYFFDQIESDFLISKLRQKSSVLEIGCGNGMLYEKIAEEKKPTFYIGTDFVQELIDECNLKLKNKCHQFVTLDMTKIKVNSFNRKFDFIISKRALQNVLCSKIQLDVIDNIGKFLNKNGKMILLESSKTAQSEINKERKKYNLDKITPPFHNLFLNDCNIKKFNFKNVLLKDIIPFASDFYYLTRVFYARYAKEFLNNPPDTNHPLYKIALTMKGDCVTSKFSQIQAYIFEKKR